MEQIHLAGEVRTGERGGRVSKAVWRLEYQEGHHRGVSLRGLVGDFGKEFISQ